MMPNYLYRCPEPECGIEETVHRAMSDPAVAPECWLCATFSRHTEMRQVFQPNLHFTYGREDFHGPTIRERQEKQLQDFPGAVPKTRVYAGR